MKLIFMGIALSLLWVSAFALTDNSTVSINANVQEICQLSLTYPVGAVRFTVAQSKFNSITRGNPLSVVSIDPDNLSGIQAVVKSNGKNGVRLEVYGNTDFFDSASGKSLSIRHLSWSSVVGARDHVEMTSTLNQCWATSGPGPVTDNLTLQMKLTTMDAFGDYQTAITYTATNL